MQPTSPATVAALLALICAAGAAGQQPAPPVFPSGVESVRVDAVVTDARGRPVTGLRREDFVLREDGVVQPIVDFEAVGASGEEGQPAAEPGETREAAHPAAMPAPTALPATFLIVFDEPHLTPEHARHARAFVTSLLAGVAAGDRVTLIAAHDGRFWSGVGPEGAREVARQLESVNGRQPGRRGNELMTPYEALRVVQGDRRVEQVVEDRLDAQRGLGDPGAGARQTDPQVQMLARATHADAAQQVRRLMDLVSQALDAAPPQRGRTTLVLASGGFIDDTTLGEYRDLVRRCVRSGVTAYFVDSRDLSIGRSLGADVSGRSTGATGGRLDLDHERRRDEELRLQSEALEGDAGGAVRLADETGGFTIRVSDTTGLARLATDARHYYLLGYQPTNSKRDGSLRRISVEVKTHGLSVRARKAYYAPREKDERRSADRAPAATAAVPARRDEAVSRYLALVETNRAKGPAGTLPALQKWQPRTLRRAAEAATEDPSCPLECRRAAVLLHTEAAVLHLSAGEADEASEQRDLARELLRRQHAGASDFERFWHHAMGDFELDQGRIPDAEELFDALVKLYPEDAEARLALGRAGEGALYLLSILERTSLADRAPLASALSYNSWRNSRAGGARETGEEAYRRSALEAYREALRLSPGLLEARLRLGRVLWLDGKRDEAARELAAVAEAPSRDGRQLAHLFLSRIEDERGRAAEALAHAEAAVAARPTWQSGLLALADLQRRAGRSREASATAARAVALPDEPASEDGWLQYNRGARARALATLGAMRAMVKR
jgi:VWFA-related protein